MQGVMSAQQAARLEELSYVAQPVPSLNLIVATPGFSELEKPARGIHGCGLRPYWQQQRTD